MNDQLAVLFAKRFVQRRDVKAVQFTSGAYVPDRELKNRQTQQPDPGRFGPLGFQMQHLHQHLTGTATYGHYMLDHEDQCRLFALDIDLEQNNPKTGHTGYYLPLPPFTSPEEAAAAAPVPLDVREAWTDRASPARPWLKYQMGMLARKFCRIITEELGIPTAAAYSGSKGIHVYGFTGPIPASQVREAALFVLDFSDEWTLKKGQHFFGHKVEDPALGYQNFSIETFPKQDTLEGKDLGNLMRLPLGRNLKSNDPTFFLDLTTPPGVMQPHLDPVRLLETGDPFQ